MMSLTFIVVGIAIILFFRKEGGFNRTIGIIILVVGVAIPAVSFISVNQELKEWRKGMILYHTGGYDDAIQIFEKLMERGKLLKLDYALYLCESYAQINNMDKANSYYEIASELFDKDRKYLTRYYSNVDDYWQKRSGEFEKDLREGKIKE
jgi:tetratricopeptide (TPR) repeat protein